MSFPQREAASTHRNPSFSSFCLSLEYFSLGDIYVTAAPQGTDTTDSQVGSRAEPHRARHRPHGCKLETKTQVPPKGKSRSRRERHESASTHLALSTSTDRVRRDNPSQTSTTHCHGLPPLPARWLSSAPWIRAFKTSTPNRISGFWLLGVTFGARECSSPENGAHVLHGEARAEC